MSQLNEKHALPVRKRKRKPVLPERHENRVPFDFVAVNTLEVCLSRLGSMQDLRDIDPWSPKAIVRIEYVNDNTYGFTVIEHEPAPVELRGYLNRLDDETTYVSGEARAKLFLQLAELLFLAGLIVLLTMFVGFFVLLLFVPPLAAFVWYYWHGVNKERDRLVRVVKDTLSYY